MLGQFRRSPSATAAAVVLTLVALAAGPAIAGGVTQVNLVSNTPDVTLRTLPFLVNAWGMTFNSTGEVSLGQRQRRRIPSLFDRFGVPQSLVIAVPLPMGKPTPPRPRESCSTAPMTSS